jgi:threonine synthase
LEVDVEVSYLTRSDLFNIRKSSDMTIWRWFDFFPLASQSSIVSLGEGCTPLIRATRLGEQLT